jgi:long-chain fatty acid transport protein
MRRTAAFVFASVLLSSSALASGFGLRDASASTLGVSYAGNAANGSVASTMVFNPALVNDVETFDIALSNTGLLPETSGDFTAYNMLGQSLGSSHSKDIVNTALVPSLALRYRITPKFALGLQVSAPWGMLTNYRSPTVTRYFATMSDVKSANVQFIAGYQLLPELSVGAGLQVQYIKGRLGKAIDVGSISYYLTNVAGQIPAIAGTYPSHNDGMVELRAQDWSMGWMIGAEWKPRPDLSIGVSYRSEVENTLKGNSYFTLDSVGQTLRSYTGLFIDAPATAGFNNPAILTMGAKWDITPQWSFLVGADWTGWSTVNNLTIHSANVHQPDDVTLFKYTDSWFGSLGVQYKPTEDWKISLGTGFDDTPTTSNYRTPGIPDGGRYWISGGIGYKVNKNIDLDLSIARLMAEKGKINLLGSEPTNANRGTLTGTVNMAVTLVGLEMNYHL